MSRIVSAGVSAGCYPKGHKWAASRTLTHLVELGEADLPVRVLCGAVKVSSILDDSTQYDVTPADCERCLRIAKRVTPAP